MKSSRTRCGYLWVLLTVTLLVGMGSVPAALANTPKKKALSLKDVTIVGQANGGIFAMVVALHMKFFTQQGVNVTFLDSSLAGGAVTDTVLAAGDGQFGIDAPTSDIPAVQEGAPLRGVMEVEDGTFQEIAINSTTAAAHGIPASGNTPASALAQFMALKGSHLNIGVSSLASSSLYYIEACAKEHGLTYGINTTGSTAYDINLIPDGSIANEEVALESGKNDGIAGIAPTTIQANTIVIELYRVTPASVGAGQYMSATTSTISQHPDTVQAVVDGEIEGMNYVESHPSAAEKIVAAFLASVDGGGITSPEEAEYIFSDYAAEAKQPYPTKAAFQGIEGIYNIAVTPPATLTYAQFVDPKFISAAGKILGITIKT